MDVVTVRVDEKTRRELEQMLGVDITKLSNWIGVLDDDEIQADSGCSG